MALQGTKALETWCRLVTEGYQHVNIMNMTTSWRSGMAFCAIIHKFRPELINFDQLDPDDCFGNNELAFTVAEQHLGIPALLDPQDMVECELLDRLSILTYLSQFYQTFHGATGPCKESTPTKLRYVTGSSCSSGASTPSKSSGRSTGVAMLPGKRSEPCKICNKPVFILERLHVSGRLLHRTCFKCARCHHQLSIANYYETESGSYCCDMCPDEEIIQSEVTEANKKLIEGSKTEETEPEDDINSLPESQRDAKTDNNNETEKDEDNNELRNPVILVTSQDDEVLEEAIEESPQVETEVKNELEIEDKDSDEIEEISQDLDEKAEINDDDDEIEDVPLPECDQKADATNETNDAQIQVEEAVANDENDEDQDNQDISYPQDLNPFGEEDDEEITEKIEENESKPESTNPFGSDSDESDTDAKEAEAPVAPPKPPRLSLNPFGSDFEDDETEEGEKKPTPRMKKKRHAPPPPMLNKGQPPPRPPPPTISADKSRKDAENLNRRSQILEDEEASVTLTPLSPDKSNMEGKWKKKKGPAPPRPIPPKRQVKKLPRKAVNMELMDIEIKQQELERQGVDLEKTIRELCEKSDKERAEAGLDNNDRDSLGPEAEDLIVQLFELVNEKNELFRRQTELMYMKREQRLEEEHADIEHQIRVLMAKPDALRTDEDKGLEDKLIERLMAIVSQRNEIVDCLEMDRLRELEEDESIEIHMGEYAAIKPQDEDEMLKKKKEKKKKEKKKKKKDKAYDADKDIDTSEFPSGASLSNSPRPSPKKSALALNDSEKAKKLKKKLLSSLKPISMKR